MNDGALEGVLTLGFIAVLLVGGLVAEGAKRVRGWYLEARTERARAYLVHEQKRLADGLPVHERCECTDCVIWRRGSSR